ncbi:MAG: right-handed parallel beta-helix repeat-containing protein [Candidatus Cloacimonetes bacterium]|nr:right-handed parallel beta-helix repeat-containing protein [Candidatus Cloacimonadota bacterium]
MLSQLNNNYGDEYLIPLVWDTDDTWGNTRYWWYPGNGYVPWVIVGGNIEPTWNNYTSYENAYLQTVVVNSPLEIDLEMNLVGDQLEITADITVTENIPASYTNPKVFFVISTFVEDPNANYVNKVVAYNTEVPFTLTTAGQSTTETTIFTLDPSWDIAEINGVVIVQSWTNTKDILQAATTSFTGLLPMFTSNVTAGPAHLGVQFTSNSFPLTGIESWEWDLDGDGQIDSTEEDPYFLYTEIGTYDITLTVFMEGDSSTVTQEDYITVTDGSNVTGNLSGIWITDFSPYNVTDAVEITSDDQLIIEPGVEVNFGSDIQLKVYGNLVADASSRDDEPIIFTSSTEWAGLRFIGTQEANLIRNCEISKANTSAILIENDSYVDVIGNKIFDNSSGSLGAAIDVTSSDNILISQNIISNNNSSNDSGGIGCLNSSIEISNNIIVNNTGTYSAFSFMNGSDVLMINNTIANNESTNGTPYLFFLFNSSPTIINSIIIDNGEIYFPQSTPIITYSCITGGFTGTGNIDDDPMFVNPSAGDGSSYDGLNAGWWLQEGSPCIDAGDPDPIYNDPDGTRNDMGAYGGPASLEPTSTNNNIVNIITKSSISIYPNPFNPQTNIALSITSKDMLHPISVGIYNIKGQLVKTLVDDEIVTNTNLIWDGTDNAGTVTSSGMYFVKMKTTTTSTAKKMILLK